MSGIEKAFENWSDSLNDIFKIIFMSPKEWNQDVWNMIQNINGGLTIVASNLIVLFFFIGMIKSGLTMQDFKRPEIAFRPLIRLAIANVFVNSSMSIMVYIFSIVQGLMSKIAANGRQSFDMSVPKEVVKALDGAGMMGWEEIQVGLIGLLLIIAVYIMSILLIVVVWGRFLKIYLFCGVSPIFVSAMAGEPTQNSSVTFIKGFCNAAFQGVIVVLALMIYSSLLTSTHSEAINAINGGDDFSGILLYAKDFLVAGLVVLGICKGADQIGSKMGL